MARQFYASAQASLVGSPQDLVGVQARAGAFARVLKAFISCADQSLPQPCQLSLAMVFLPASVTPGTGGTSTLPQPVDQGDAPPQSYSWQHSTGLAISSNPAPVPQIIPLGCHIYQGLEITFAEPLPMLNGQAWVFRLLQAPASPANLVAWLLIEEFGYFPPRPTWTPA